VKASDHRQREPEPGTRTDFRARRWHSSTALIWASVVLAVLLGMTRALVGLWGVDVVAIVFGVMTPAARAVYALLGVAAVYCVITVVSRQFFRRAGRQ
jgi:uncharacterized membrane protein YuzA (DUF378 family)